MKYTRCLLVVFVLFGCLAIGNDRRADAQDAKVKVLTDADAERAAQLYREFKEAEKAFSEFKEDIERRYTTAPLSSKQTGMVKEYGKVRRVVINGWSGGIQFSDDFKAIIPVPFSNGVMYYNGSSYWPVATSPTYHGSSVAPVSVGTVTLSTGGTSATVPDQPKPDNPRQ